MSTARRLNYIYQDYLRALADSHIKLEFCDGQIYAMAGGTAAHAELGMRAGHLLMQSLPASCRVYSSDLRLRIESTDLSTFPDVTVVCGQREMSAIDPNAAGRVSTSCSISRRSAYQSTRSTTACNSTQPDSEWREPTPQAIVEPSRKRTIRKHPESDQ